MLKKFKKISIVLGVLLLLLGGVGFIFSTIYEDEVKAYIVDQINQSVNTKIDVKEVDFSVFKKFPYASLEFKKVTADEISELDEKGILFSAQSIYLQFNVIDILKKNYAIKKIHVENGIVNVHIDEDGNDNYHFLKESDDTLSSSLNIELENLRFKEVTFYVLNEYKDVDMAIEAIDLSLSGNFSEDNFTLQTQADLFVHQINEEGQSILKDKSIAVNTALAVDQKTQHYTIEKGEIAIQDLLFNLSGDIENKEEGVELNVLSEGANLEIEALFSLFPEKQREALEAYSTKGNITYSSTVKGLFSAKETPSFIADFRVEGGQIIEKSSNNSLNNINVSGSYTNGDKNNSQTSQLNLDQLDANFGAGHISGNYTITNFANPYIELNSKADIDIETAKEFFKLDTLEMANGNLIIDLKYKGYIKELSDIKAKDLQRLNANGTARLINANIKLLNSNRSINDINGVFQFNNNDIKIDTLKLKMNQSDIELRGQLKNFLAYLFIENEELLVNAKILSSQLILDDILLENDGTEENSSYTLHLPDNIRFTFRTAIDTFQFRKFKAYNLGATINLNQHVLKAMDVAFNAMEGTVKGNVIIDNSQEKEILITSKTSLTGISVYQLFYQFENFGQDYILDENLKGRANANIKFVSIWDKQLNVKEDKIYTLADLTINNGELIDYKPILAMSKFIEVEELEHIKFSKLTTKIEIKDKTIFIPKTEIKSSAIDVTLSGTHTFNNEIDYHFKLLMGDVLWNKAKNEKKENLEFGYIEDDGLGKTSLFLSMTGTVDDYKLSYDTKGLKESWAEDLKEEKKTIKQVLKKEFGWFKKDTTIKEQKKPKDDGFAIEWEESNNDQEETKEKNQEAIKNKKKTEKKKKGLGKLLDKLAEPEEEFEESDEF